MRIAIAYPPLKSEKGVALLIQNRQFQWFSRPTYIFPVVPATAATMLKQAGHEVLFLDGIAAEMTAEEFEKHKAAFARPFDLAKGPALRFEIVSTDSLHLLSSSQGVVYNMVVPSSLPLTGGSWVLIISSAAVLLFAAGAVMFAVRKKRRA